MVKFLITNKKLTDFSDEAVARKFNLISPISDTGDVCKALVKEYDQKINEAIEAGRPISIEEMIESPSLITLQCFEGDMINTESRWLVFLHILVILLCNRFLYRLLATVAEIHKHFWLENEHNIHYKALYKIFECISKLHPSSWFELPLIESKLEECANNTTKYQLWGKGNGFFLSKHDRNGPKLI